MGKAPVSRRSAASASWDADRVMIEPGHDGGKGLLPQSRHPEIGPAQHPAPIGKGAAQVKSKVGCALLQPSPPAAAGAAAWRRGIEQRRETADRIERKAYPQQQQDHLLQSPTVPAPWRNAGRQAGTGMPAAWTKETGNRNGILLPGSRPIGLAGVMAMMPGMAKTTVRALGGAIAFRISGQGVAVMLKGGDTCYDTMQGRTSYGFGYRESLIHFPR